MTTPRNRFLGAAIVLTALALIPVANAQPAACASRSSGEGARIDEAEYLSLGGVEQFVTTRGSDRRNPVLLHVHGGPGTAFSAFAAEFAPFEAQLTVVQWDQRGAGCTFARHGEQLPELTLDAVARDGIELAAQLRGRFEGRQLLVLGHSFGSIVALEMVRRAPEHFALYVGTGQFGSLASNVDAQIALLRERAADDPARIAELDALTALAPLQKFGGVNQLLSSYMPAPDVTLMRGLPARAAEVMTADELAAWLAGRQATGSRLIQQIADVDLLATARRLELPVLVIQGSADLVTPTRAVQSFLAQVDAPTKELVVIDGAGHFPHLTHTQEFLAALSPWLR